MATASASAASVVVSPAVGSRRRIMKPTWALSALPVPTTAFLTTVAAYSATVSPARAGLTVAEYAATVVKKAVVGTGSADKAQVGFMIRRLLPTAGDTTTDAADALAVAIAHAHARRARTY